MAPSEGVAGVALSGAVTPDAVGGAADGPGSAPDAPDGMGIGPVGAPEGFTPPGAPDGQDPWKPEIGIPDGIPEPRGGPITVGCADPDEAGMPPETGTTCLLIAEDALDQKPSMIIGHPWEMGS